MKPPAYYNENDPQAARWLKELIHEGLIAPGDVDDRSIRDVRGSDLRGYAQCHFFAGIGIWSHALRRAGWPDDRRVWTGSCPCQPFSQAGKGLGFDDPRHLFPDWLRLIAECRPDRILGEQSSNAGAWVDLVRSELEAIGFAFGCPDLPAAGFRGAHIRQRFVWVADADNAEWWAERAPGNIGDWPATGRVESYGDLGECFGAGRVGDAELARRQAAGGGPEIDPGSEPEPRRSFGGLADATSGGRGEFGNPSQPRRVGYHDGGFEAGGLGLPDATRLSDAQLGIIRRSGRFPEGRATEQSGNPPGTGVDWLLCRDSKWRPVEPGASPLVDAYPSRMALLRGIGNALDAETATQFVSAYMDALP